MIDVKPLVVSTLRNKTGLEVHDELTVDSKTSLPVITYQEYNSYDEETGETFGYGATQFMIKLWGYVEKDMMPQLLSIDSSMRKLGFHRISKNELIADDRICYLALYQGKTIENYE